uniref:Uncharacterized protein n=1 Tax=Myoviridae sp. ctFPV8 TaxID=2825068 RepID=A0A8S5PCG1_9CAUD|nr:MAG TPA: hypothetical protein [Myoviridae sp. ctFPV8]DAU30724.1 MAG TPA: hypothetical protein [Bacteriophage sp.]DAX82325.1 MAG TPA: hypothetical protein [Caudoviricetes sp.]
MSKNIFNGFKLNETSEASASERISFIRGSIATYRPGIYYVFKAF